MTVSNASNKSGPFWGDGTPSQVFSFDLDEDDSSRIRVVHMNSSSIEVDLVEGSDYTIDMGLKTVTITSFDPESDEKITILNEVPNLQETVVKAQGPWSPKVIEAALDDIVKMTQANAERVSRALKVGVSGTYDPDTLTVENFILRPKLLDSVDLDSVSEIILSTDEEENFDAFEVEVVYLVTDLDPNILMKISSTGGAPWHTQAAGSGARNISNGAAPSADSGVSAGGCLLSLSAGKWLTGRIITSTTPSLFTHMRASLACEDGSLQMNVINAAFSASLGVSGVPNAYRFYPQSSGVISGKLRLWGLPRT